MTNISRQTSLPRHTYLQREIRKIAFQPVKNNRSIGPSQPIRAFTVGLSKLVSIQDEIEQISLFDTENEKRSRQDKLEQVVDGLRKKHGFDSIWLGSQENKEIGVTRGERIDRQAAAFIAILFLQLFTCSVPF